MTLTAKGRATQQRIIAGTAAYLRSDEPGEVTLDDVRAVTKTSGALDDWPAWDAWCQAVIARYRVQGAHCTRCKKAGWSAPA
jgi:hypothetical protein